MKREKRDLEFDIKQALVGAEAGVKEEEEEEEDDRGIVLPWCCTLCFVDTKHAFCVFFAFLVTFISALLFVVAVGVNTTPTPTDTNAVLCMNTCNEIVTSDSSSGEPNQPSFPSSGEPSSGAESDGVCNDGGKGSNSSTCLYGYDCLDCGIRFPYPPPPSPPPPRPPPISPPPIPTPAPPIPVRPFQTKPDADCINHLTQTECDIKASHLGWAFRVISNTTTPSGCTYTPTLSGIYFFNTDMNSTATRKDNPDRICLCGMDPPSTPFPPPSPPPPSPPPPSPPPPSPPPPSPPPITPHTTRPNSDCIDHLTQHECQSKASHLVWALQVVSMRLSQRCLQATPTL